MHKRNCVTEVFAKECLSENRHGPWDYLASNRVPEIFLSKALSARKANNLTTFREPIY
jgi:hypothetical protein